MTVSAILVPAGKFRSLLSVTSSGRHYALGFSSARAGASVFASLFFLVFFWLA